MAAKSGLAALALILVYLTCVTAFRAIFAAGQCRTRCGMEALGSPSVSFGFSGHQLQDSFQLLAQYAPMSSCTLACHPAVVKAGFRHF
ncbi:hypothetical protein [Hymenobacter ruricola]|uniref:hypothetical protein n=1 Tax=Hymenobacter ruricola TaxID=2791023 RepID=UPI0018AFA4AD|nr:hypothetical protein [Hymenobacter ruricola]